MAEIKKAMTDERISEIRQELFNSHLRQGVCMSDEDFEIALCRAVLATSEKAASSNAIEKSKRILALVDDYLHFQTKEKRDALRHGLLDAFEAQPLPDVAAEREEPKDSRSSRSDLPRVKPRPDIAAERDELHMSLREILNIVRVCRKDSAPLFAVYSICIDALGIQPEAGKEGA